MSAKTTFHSDRNIFSANESTGKTIFSVMETIFLISGDTSLDINFPSNGNLFSTFGNVR